MTITAFSTASGRADHPDPGRTRVLWVACGAHALHDGLTDTLYLLLPLWQAQFALSYAAIGLLRALYTGVMAGFQVPAAKLAQRMGGARMLAGGTAVAAVAYLLLAAQRLSSSADDWRDRQRDADGFSHLPAVSVAIKRGRALGDGARLDKRLRRRR